MDISPYLTLMIDKSAANLSFSTGTVPRVMLDGQERTVGNATTDEENMNDIFDELAMETQKLQLSVHKSVRFVASVLDGKKLIAEVKVLDDGGMTIVVTHDKREEQNRETVPENITLFGKCPEGGLDLLPYLTKMVELEGSDLFITAGAPVKSKVHGHAIKMDDYELTAELTKSAAYAIMNDEQIEKFEKTKDLDFAIELPDGSARFRVNVFYQRRTVAIVLRLIPTEIPTAKQLDLPEVMLELIMAKRGLLLMVGGTGSGKSTSLAAMLNHRNHNSSDHILTIEDPVEFSHPNVNCIVNQREVGVDTESYARALKASLREAPDVILVGEIRDRETMEAALELANTGHLCVSTMHANNANQAMERIINMFPQVSHKQLFMDLSTNLAAVISQRLIKDVRGKRCAAIEVMLCTPHISNLILKGELNEIKEAMNNSGARGMQTFDTALLQLYTDGKISLGQALRNADSRNDLEAKINFG